MLYPAAIRGTGERRERSVPANACVEAKVAAALERCVDRLDRSNSEDRRHTKREIRARQRVPSYPPKPALGR